MIADRLAGQIMVIGYAPTALLALLEALNQGAPAPALVVGMPVGFVNAAQSKELLRQSPGRIFTCWAARALWLPASAACVNALAELAPAKNA